jgi:hypothetical protein
LLPKIKLIALTYYIPIENFLTLKELLFVFYLMVVASILHAQGWAELGIGSNALNANNGIAAICADSGGIIYAAGGFTDTISNTNQYKYVAKWTGTSWIQVGTGINALKAIGGIHALCIDKMHNIYVGTFVKDSINHYEVAKWDGVSWNQLGIGSSALNANSDIYSICLDRSGNVYVAGDFTNTSGFKYVAKWDGNTWTELGADSNALNANDDIRAIISDSAGNIYAAGSFRNSFGGNCYVAKWNGASWSELGSGINALNANFYIFTLCMDVTDNIYAAGGFTDSSGNIYVAKWNGTTWSELGSNGLHVSYIYFINSICTDASGNVLAGGEFQDAKGKYYVARWNGKEWSELGTGSNALNANGFIFSICSDAEGNIYAGGGFTDNGDTPDSGHCYVARYDGFYEYVPNTATSINKIKIFPNPASDEIEISATDDLTGERYVFYTMTGEILESGVLKNSATVLHVNGIAAGTYILQVGKTAYNIIKK